MYATLSSVNDFYDIVNYMPKRKADRRLETGGKFDKARRFFHHCHSGCCISSQHVLMQIEMQHDQPSYLLVGSLSAVVMRRKPRHQQVNIRPTRSFS